MHWSQRILSENSSLPFGATPEDADLSETLGLWVQIVVVLSLLLYMTGVGVALDLDRFKDAWKRPKAPLVGLFGQIVVNPFVIMGLLKLLGGDFTVETKVMALIIAASPGGNGSALLTYLSFGHTETSIAMTLISTVVAFATIPLFIFLGTEVFFPEALELEIAFESIVLSALAASLPPLFGIWLKKKRLKADMVDPVKNVLIISGIVFSVAAGLLTVADPIFRLGVKALGGKIWLVAFLFNSSALAFGYFLAFVACLADPERRAVAFEVGVQNLSIPLAVVNLSFGTGVEAAEFTPFLGVYVIMGLCVNYPCMMMFRYVFPIDRMKDDDERPAIGLALEA